MNWTRPSCRTKRGEGQWESGSAGESEIRNKGEVGEFLRELHSLSTSGYIRSSQRRDQTGTDNRGSKNKGSRLGQDSWMTRKVKVRRDKGNYGC